MYKTLSIPQLTVIIPFLNEGGEGFGYGNPTDYSSSGWEGSQCQLLKDLLVGLVF